jgi:hypothetical protein
MAAEFKMAAKLISLNQMKTGKPQQQDKDKSGFRVSHQKHKVQF